MPFDWYHANASVLKSLNLGASASFVPLLTILILNPVNSSKSSTLNWYSLNWPATLGETKASGLPLFLEGSMTWSPKPSPSVSRRLS